MDKMPMANKLIRIYRIFTPALTGSASGHFWQIRQNPAGFLAGFPGSSGIGKFQQNCRLLRTTRKPSCRGQTRATLAKSLHGLRKSSGVVSCIARLPIDSLPMVFYYVLYSNYL